LTQALETASIETSLATPTGIPTIIEPQIKNQPAPYVELHTVTPHVAESPTVVVGTNTAASEMACVWGVEPGNSLFSTIRKFQLSYQDSATYYYFESCDLKAGICKGTRKEIENHSSIESGWFVIIPVDNPGACQNGNGAWVDVQP
jgi:hypothetical protein